VLLLEISHHPPISPALLARYIIVVGRRPGRDGQA
jgi:hypothetical protein